MTHAPDLPEDRSSFSVIAQLTVSDRAYAAIEGAIVRGEIAPGARINEPSLSAQLGVSRGSLREAIRRLEGEKLVVRVPHFGARVATLSTSDLLDIYDMREALEGMSVRLATERMSDGQITLLGEVLDRHAREISSASEGYFQGVEAEDFHFLIARSTGNKRLEDLLCGEFYHLLRMYRFYSSTTAGRAASALAEHRKILAAISARDPDGAEVLMRGHIRRSRESLQRRELAALPGHGGDPRTLRRSKRLKRFPATK